MLQARYYQQVQTLLIASLAGAGSVDISSDTLSVGAANTSTAFSGEIFGSGNLDKVGAGSLTLSGANTYIGSTTVSAGTLTTTNANSIADGSAVNVADGATFDVDASLTVGSIASVAGGVIDIESSGVTLTAGDGVDTTIAGTIVGAGGFTKVGTSITEISGANTGYTGAVAASAGTLLLNNADALSSSNAVTLSSAATMDVTLGVTIGDLTGGVSNIIDITNLETLTAGGTGDTTYAGASTTTTGLFIKSGSGALTLSGTMNYNRKHHCICRYTYNNICKCSFR